MIEAKGLLSSSNLVSVMETNLSDRVEDLRQVGTLPNLAIFNDNLSYEPSVMYSNLKIRIAEKLGMLATLTEEPNTDILAERIKEASENDKIHGIIVQMPSVDKDRTEELLRLIDPKKDVDGLGINAPHMPATPMAIVRLLEYYNVNILEEKVAILGQGRLVGRPLFEYCRRMHALDVMGYDEYNHPLDIIDGINKASVIITAMGLPKEITPDYFNSMEPKVLVDAGAAELGGVIVGDVSDELREAALEHGWGVTPERGGVGPVTVRMLLENTIKNAHNQAFKPIDEPSKNKF